ncbi:EamA family transporter [Rubellimicrobium thermophilum]|nr:EamA family transporter [Rubellimicrobium thermophilum]
MSLPEQRAGGVGARLGAGRGDEHASPTGIGLILAAGVLWSLQGLFIRQIGTAGPWAILFWRSLGMIPVLAGFLVWRAGGGSPLPALRRAGLAGVMGGLALVAAFAGAIVALQSTTVANAVFLFAASPILAALLGLLVLGERVAAATGAAIAAALAGIFLMMREGLAAGAALGNGAALLSALGFAAFTVALRLGRLHDTLPTVLLGAVFAMLAGRWRPCCRISRCACRCRMCCGLSGWGRSRCRAAWSSTRWAAARFPRPRRRSCP